MQVGTYNNIRGHLHFLKDSYRGGFNYNNPAQSTLASVDLAETGIDKDGNVVVLATNNFRSYLVPHDGESTASFASRAKTACYINLVQPVVSAYVDAATSKTNTQFGKLQDSIPEDVDTQGSSYREFIRNVATEDCVSGWTYVIVDVQPEDPSKIRYIMVDPTAVCQIVTDDFGKLVEFVFITQSEVANASAPSIQDITVVRINAKGVHTLSGQVDFAKGFDLDKLEVTSSIPLAPGLNGQLPVIVSYFKKDTSSIVPVGISLIETQASIGREVYNLLSYSQDILRVHFPQLTYPIKMGEGSLTPEAQRAVGTKVSLTYSSDGNSPSYINPSKDSTDALMAQTDFLINQAYSAAHLDLASSAGINSSGFALTVKSREFENAVKRFAEELSKFEQKLLAMSAKVLGIQGDPGFTVVYPDRFTPIDISSALQNAKTVLEIADKYKLETAKKEALLFIASNALPLSDEALTKVTKEIMSQGFVQDQTQSSTETAQASLPAPGGSGDPPTS